MAWIKGTSYSDDIDGTSYDDTIEGFEGHDEIWGYAGHDDLYGDAGDDVLVGGSGDDNLDGGTGWDEMEGGIGDDVYYVDSTGDEVIEFAGEGIDAVYTLLSTYTLSANVEDLLYEGSADFYGTGNALDNDIYGNIGDDVLNGGLGNDRLIGETGNDTYYVDDAGDLVVEGTGEGRDIVFTSLSALVLAANVEELIFDGAGAFRGTGNALANYIEGGTGSDVLEGRDGNDTLLGLDGNDRLVGGLGADTMYGGLGNDIYVVDNSGDRVVESSATGGTDLVQSTIGFTLGSHVEKLTLTGTGAINGTGNGLANVLTGNGAANVLYGLGGKDSLDGGAGNDKLVGGLGNDILKGGAGADIFMFDTALNGSTNVDRIVDFFAPDDTIALSRAAFNSFGSTGTLSASAFRAGTSAQDSSDRIVYDQATGKIFFDADGNGAGAATLFAQVAAGTALTNVDFLIVA